MDTLTKQERSERMSRVRGKNTGPELVVRQVVKNLGHRYRLHGKLPGKPDLVFSSKRKVIFVHGCYWHRHAAKSCKLARLPKTRLDFWLPKLEANKARDFVNRKRLRVLGWRSLVIWECQLQKASAVEARIKRFLTDSSLG